MANQQTKKKKKLNKFLVFGLPIIVVLLAAGAFFAYRYLPVFNQDQQTIENKADDLAYSMMDGDTDKAASGYDKLLENVSSDKERADIYLDRAWSYINYSSDKHLEKAKQDALQAEKLDPSVSSALALKSIGEKLKDKELSSEYSKKYDERMKKADLPGGP